MPREKIRFDSFGRNIYAWGLVHAGDRFGEPRCRIKAMSSPSHTTSDEEPITCMQCIALDAAFIV